MIEEVDREKLQVRLTDSSPFLIDFWSPVCGRCYALRPQLERALEGEQGSAVAVNVFDAPDLAEEYAVSSLPTVLIVQDGTVRKRFTDPILSTDVIETLHGYQKQVAAS
jgi:thioredoxin 1